MMIGNQNLNSFIQWQAEDIKNRMVHITIEIQDNKQHIRIWVYDYKLMVGQFVKGVEEIDLVKMKMKKDKKKLAELKKEYGE